MLNSVLIRTVTKIAERRMPGAPRFAQLRNAAFYLGSQGHHKESAEVYAHAIDEFASAPQSVLDEHEDLFVGFIPFCLVELGILHVRHGAVSDAIIAFDRALVTTTTELNAIPAPKDAFVTYDPSVDCATTERNTLRYRRWLSLQIEVKKHYAMALKAAGDFHSAGGLLCQLMRLYREGIFRSGLIYSDICFHLAEILNSQGKFSAAEPVIRDCVSHRRALFLGPDSDIAAIAAAAAKEPDTEAASAAAVAAVTGGAGCAPGSACAAAAAAAAAKEKEKDAAETTAAASEARPNGDGAASAPAGSASPDDVSADPSTSPVGSPLCEAGGACSRIPKGDTSFAAVTSCAGEIGVERMNARPCPTASTLDEIARASIAVGKAGAIAAAAAKAAAEAAAGGDNSACCDSAAAKAAAAKAAAAAAEDQVESEGESEGKPCTDDDSSAGCSRRSSDELTASQEEAESLADAATAAVIEADEACKAMYTPTTCPGAAAAAATGCPNGGITGGGAPGTPNGPCPVAAAASSCFSFGSCPRSRVCGPAGKTDPAAEGAAEVAVALCLLGTTIAAPEIGKYTEAEECLREAIVLLDIACARGTSGVCDERGCMAALLSSVSAARAAAEGRAAAAAEEAAPETAVADAAAAAGGEQQAA